MKLSKKFLEDLHKIGQDAFWEKNMWVGKLVPEIIVDNLKKRGISQDDIEGVICLTVEEAKEAIADYIDVVAEVVRQRNKPEIKIKHPKSILILMERIEQAEKSNGNLK